MLQKQKCKTSWIATFSVIKWWVSEAPSLLCTKDCTPFFPRFLYEHFHQVEKDILLNTHVSLHCNCTNHLPELSPEACWGAVIWTWSLPPWTAPSCHTAWRLWRQNSCLTRPSSRLCGPPELGFPRTVRRTVLLPWRRPAAAPHHCCYSSCCLGVPPGGPYSVTLNLMPPHMPLPKTGQDNIKWDRAGDNDEGWVVAYLISFQVALLKNHCANKRHSIYFPINMTRIINHSLWHESKMLYSILGFFNLSVTSAHSNKTQAIL